MLFQLIGRVPILSSLSIEIMQAIQRFLKITKVRQVLIISSIIMITEVSGQIRVWLMGLKTQEGSGYIENPTSMGGLTPTELG